MNKFEEVASTVGTNFDLPNVINKEGVNEWFDRILESMELPYGVYTVIGYHSVWGWTRGYELALFSGNVDKNLPYFFSEPLGKYSNGKRSKWVINHKK